jgi:serine/threonine protein kinase
VSSQSALCTQCGNPSSSRGDLCASCAVRAAQPSVAGSHSSISNCDVQTLVGTLAADDDRPTPYPGSERRTTPVQAATESSELGPHLSANYEVVRLLGEGGMGRVHLAVHRSIGRQVAIKTIHGLDAATRARFVREWQALARLSHPNVVQLIDAGEDGPVPYLVCEYVDGDSLGVRLRRSSNMTLDAIVSCFGQILAGLEHAHDRDVIHRDLKPDNILITHAGVAKVADFGLASCETPQTAGLTRAGALMGTPAYMSPEQARGEKMTAATDIYSAGVILFEMCTGRVPFAAPSFPEVLVLHITAPVPDPRTQRPDLPYHFAELIKRALAKEPADRWTSAGEFLRALQRAARACQLKEETVQAVPAPEAPPLELHSVQPVRNSQTTPAAQHPGPSSKSNPPRTQALSNELSSLLNLPKPEPVEEWDVPTDPPEPPAPPSSRLSESPTPRQPSIPPAAPPPDPSPTRPVARPASDSLRPRTEPGSVTLVRGIRPTIGKSRTTPGPIQSSRTTPDPATAADPGNRAGRSTPPRPRLTVNIPRGGRTITSVRSATVPHAPALHGAWSSSPRRVWPRFLLFALLSFGICFAGLRYYQNPGPWKANLTQWSSAMGLPTERLISTKDWVVGEIRQFFSLAAQGARKTLQKKPHHKR